MSFKLSAYIIWIPCSSRIYISLSINFLSPFLKISLSLVDGIGFALALHLPGSKNLFSISFEISWYNVGLPKVEWNLGTHGQVLVS